MANHQNEDTFAPLMLVMSSISDLSPRSALEELRASRIASVVMRKI